MVLAHLAERRHVSPGSPSTSPYLSHKLLDSLDSNTYLAANIPAPLDLSYIDFPTVDTLRTVLVPVLRDRHAIDDGQSVANP